jgi:hypothetical protein
MFGLSRKSSASILGASIVAAAVMALVAGYAAVSHNPQSEYCVAEEIAACSMHGMNFLDFLSFLLTSGDLNWGHLSPVFLSWFGAVFLISLVVLTISAVSLRYLRARAGR